MQIAVQVGDESQISTAQQTIGDLLRERHRLASDQADDFNIRSNSEIITRMSTVTETMTDPPPEWLEGHQGKITHTRGVATGTRERLLSVAEADELIAAELAGRDEAAQAETARQVATALGYPPEFGRPS